MKVLTIATLFLAGALAVPFNLHSSTSVRDVAVEVDVPNRMKGTHGNVRNKRRQGGDKREEDADGSEIIGKLLKAIEMQSSGESSGKKMFMRRQDTPPFPANGTAESSPKDPRDVTVGAAIDVLGEFVGAAGDKYPELMDAAKQLDTAIKDFNEAAQSVAVPAESTVQRDVVDERVSVSVSAREAAVDLEVPEASIGTFLDVVENIAAAVGKQFPELKDVASKLEEGIQAFRKAAGKIDVTIPTDA